MVRAHSQPIFRTRRRVLWDVGEKRTTSTIAVEIVYYNSDLVFILRESLLNLLLHKASL